jgi:DNA anti-recombination protein RmuC
MTPTPQRAAAETAAIDGHTPLDLTADQMVVDSTFDEGHWTHSRAEEKGAGGRQVLGWALALLGALWLGYSAWSAGRTLAGQPLTSPAVAQWIAVAAGPLALLGLVWLMFGRTRRKEAERFTRSVVAMRGEAQSLEALLEVLSQRLHDSRAELAVMSQSLMQLGDEATGRLGGITREFDASSATLKRHGEALDRAAEAARNDIAVVLDDLPRAEATARELAERLHAIGTDTNARTGQLVQQVGTLAEHSESAERTIAEATERLAERLAAIDAAGSAATESINRAESGFSGSLDSLLDRTSQSLAEIRTGIDAQAAAVAALVEQAAAGTGKAGADAAESLATNVERANSALEGMASRVAEQDRASQQMIAEIDRGLALIDQRFTELAANGDERANHFLGSLTRARAELDSLSESAQAQDESFATISARTDALRDSIERLSADIGGANEATAQLASMTGTLKPEMDWIRDAANEAGERLAAAGTDIAGHQDRFAALLAQVDDGVGGAQSKLSELASVMAQVEREAASLTAETGPALVGALVQVKEAAAHAAERAREAIDAVIPESAGKLSEETKAALERVIRDSIEDRLRGVEGIAAQAVDAARAASDRLTQQMLTLGQSAAALEQHVERTEKQAREKDSEAFARRVALLIDSMHSAAIDVGKILADEIDDKAWAEYLKGNRGVFTRRAVRLIGGSEIKAIRAHYETDLEFQRSANRYVHDFEAMLRRVLAEREGGMMAVTLMSSDMGKLYAAISPVIDRAR